ncbi:MAG: flagellar filament capping protein FliD [Lachnospiraceae bacterium]|nr:flagellar filament capping protein FliD [Lachnospiraceae bacterium]
MASISGASLGNTSLRGYGGLASGIDRDSIIEQMSLATNTKIQNQKNSITSLTWKQEAYRSVIDKILDLQDNYLSYSGANNLLDSSMFAKNIITANGSDKVTKYISASGSSELLDYISVRGVESLATAANMQSGTKGTGAIETGMDFFEQPKTSNLQGTQLIFGRDGTEGRFNTSGTFTLPSSYKNEDGKTVEIDYTTTDMEKLAGQLNEAIKANKFKVQDDLTIQFEAQGDKLQMKYASLNSGLGKDWELSADQSTAEDRGKGVIIRSNSSALKAMGFDSKNATQSGNYGYELSEINDHISEEDFQKNYVKTYDSMAEYLKGKKFTVTYGGTSKSLELISSADAEELANKYKELKDLDPTSADYEAQKEKLEEELDNLFKDKMQAHLDKAFGTGKVEVGLKDGRITFDNAKKDGTTLTISANSWAVAEMTGLDKMSSNKVSLDSSLYDNRERLGLVTEDNKDMTEEEFNQMLADEGFVVNGVKIGGLTSKTTVNQLISKINSSGAGVRANYLSTSNKFTLVSKETGSGRDITVGGLADKVFGGTGSTSEDGQDAVMYVDYGTGTPEKLVSSSNSFDLDGMKVSVSGTFGVIKEEAPDGTESIKFETSEAVTFGAKADVDNVTEKVKKFIEDFNALVKEVNTQVTTKPDSDYGPLTDEQKDEMSEESIKNWENKAKEGLLYNNASMRDLSMDIQSIMTKLLSSGVSYDDLEEIGITASEDIYDGGTLVFDEAKFKAAMTSDPEKVSNIFTGGGDSKKGLTSIMSDTLKTYATRYAYLNGSSYGRLVEEAGSEKITLSVQNNTIYKQLKDMQEVLTGLRTRLKSEQDRYIKQFTAMEQAINNMNSQSSFLSSLGG